MQANCGGKDRDRTTERDSGGEGAGPGEDETPTRKVALGS